MKLFGELLRNFRRSRNMTQQEMADRLHLSSPYIAQMESGFKPPPPQAIVDNMATIMRLGIDEKKQFTQAAETERELQSLVKATRKVGYVLAGNKVCVPQNSIIERAQNEVEELVESIPKDADFCIDLAPSDRRKWHPGKTSVSISRHGEMRSWMIAELGNQPGVLLVFLGNLYEVLLLTPDERLLCRHPSERRMAITENGDDINEFFQRVNGAIKKAISLAEEQRLPEVIAPHVAWRDIDEMLGASQASETGQQTHELRAGSDSIRNIPVLYIVEAGSEELEERPGLGSIGLPHNWFDSTRKYEACKIQTDAYISIGVWPGCKTIYELSNDAENEDLVIVKLGNRICFRRYFDFGDQILLQGGPLAKPIRVLKGESSIRFVGVVRELVSRFRDIQYS